jgi:hypothetical protein
MALRDESRNGESLEKAAVYYYVCPSCGKRHDIRRRYCGCHALLGATGESVYSSGDRDIAVGGAVNVDFPNVSCDDCGAGCKVCYSFSVMKKNFRGFGGEDCARRSDDLRCACCQAIMQAGFKLDAAKDIVMRMSERRRERGA